MFDSTLCKLSQNKWVAGMSGKSALIVLVSAHHRIAFHSPAGSPTGKICLISIQNTIDTEKVLQRTICILKRQFIERTSWPPVLDQPIIHAVLGTITHYEHSMIMLH